MRKFTNFAVVDWSGQAVAKPKGLAVAHAEAGTRAPVLLAPPGGWSRVAILQWIERLAAVQSDILIGLDLSPSLPFADREAFFPGWSDSPADAHDLWELVDSLSQSDKHLSATSFIQNPEVRRHFRQINDCGDRFEPGRGRLRECERRQAVMKLSPQSCFNLVGAAQVGKSSLTGMRVLHRLRGKVSVWPFDPVPDTGPVIVEIYTSLAARAAGMRKGLSKVRGRAALDGVLGALQSDAHHPISQYDDHSTDALLTTAWLRGASTEASFWNPTAFARTPAIARTEGWTFGVL